MELLVVVTIIVILLALLAPALDRAVYQAELVSCAGRLKVIGSGVTVYAMESRNQYPARPWLYQTGWRPNHLWNRTAGAFDRDERTLIRPYVGRLNQTLQCPFNKEMEIDPTGPSDPSNAATESNQGWGSYYLLYGWGYYMNKNFEKAMRKIGDKFEYTDTGDGSQPPVVYGFDILANDYEMYDQGTYPNVVGSHPDQGDGAVMFQYVLDGESASTYPVGTPGTMITISRWAARAKRSTIDMNFAHGDGSVRRLNDVALESSPGVPDERMATLLEASNKSGTFYTRLPPSN